MTSVFAETYDDVVAAPGVYAPQHDSRLLCEVVRQTRLARGRRVADLCTGSGVVAIEAALLGAASVVAFDVSETAAKCAHRNAIRAGVDLDVRCVPCSDATEFGPFDLVLCNPPYVPQPSEDESEPIPRSAGPACAFNAGGDGRLVLDPLCTAAPELLGDAGTLLLVHSEFSNTATSLATLRAGGLKAAVVARRWVPFGPVLEARAAWLERTGLLEPGRRTEELVVIRADVP